MQPSAFKGTPTGYADKVRPNGGEDLVVCGPTVSFVPGEELQLSLF